MDTKALERNTAKNNLREALSQQGGDLKAKPVVAAMSQLTTLNPTVNLTQNPSLIEGNWLLLNAPNFPGGKKTEDGQYIYTLGRLAFNLFQPKDLQILILRVVQLIFPMKTSEKLTYNIEIEFTTRDANSPELQGVVINQGRCTIEKDLTLQVQFIGGELAPLNTESPEAMKNWISVFGEQKSLKSLNLAQRFQSFLVQSLFGLEPPKGINYQTGKISFTMSKSPKACLEILYLDEELRITRGNRGTITVCQRI